MLFKKKGGNTIMANKFAEYLTWVLIVLACLGLLWLIVEPIIWWSEYSELRLYIRLFLIMFALSTFAILRLYNSIVQNTRFTIKLREAIRQFNAVVPGLERAMKNLNSTLGNVKASSDSLRKSTDNNTDKVEKFTEKLTQLKTKN